MVTSSLWKTLKFEARGEGGTKWGQSRFKGVPPAESGWG